MGRRVAAIILGLLASAGASGQSMSDEEIQTYYLKLLHAERYRGVEAEVFPQQRPRLPRARQSAPRSSVSLLEGGQVKGAIQEVRLNAFINPSIGRPGDTVTIVFDVFSDPLNPPSLLPSINGVFSGDPNVNIPQGQFGNWTCAPDSPSGFQCQNVNGELLGADSFSIPIQLPQVGQDTTITLDLTAACENCGVTNTAAAGVNVILGPPAADLGILKFLPAPSGPYEVAQVPRFTAAIFNSGPDVADDFDVVFNFADDTVLAFDGDQIADDFDCTAQSETVVTCLYVGKGLPAFSGADVSIDLRAVGPGTVPVNVSVSSDAMAPDPDLTNNDAMVSATVEGALDIQLILDKKIQGGLASFTEGEQIVFDLDFSNQGTDPASSINLIDNLPQEVSFVSFTSSSPDVDCTIVAQQVECIKTGGLAAGEIVLLSLVTVADTPTTTATNTAQLTSPGATAASDSVNFSIAAAPSNLDLAIDKSVDQNQLEIGEQATFTISIHNVGDTETSNFSLTDTLPENLSFVQLASVSPELDCTPPAVGATGAELNCVYAGAEPFAPATSLSLVIVAQAEVAGLGKNSVSLSVPGDTDTSNNISSIEVDVNGLPDLFLRKDGPAQIITGQEFLYELSIRNVGGAATGNFQVIDTLPNEVTFENVSGQDFDCLISGASLVICTYTGAPLPPNQNRSISILVTGPDTPRDFTNRARIQPGDPDANPDNNEDFAETSVVMVADPMADLRLEQTGPGTALAGSAVQYDFELFNVGPSTATMIELENTVPAGASFVSFTGMGWDCADQEATILCSLAALEDDAISSLSLIFDAPEEPGEIRNDAIVRSSIEDPVPSNNEATVVTLIEPVPIDEADLALSFGAVPATVTVGDTFAFELTLSNIGPLEARNVVLSGQLSSGLQLLSVAGSGALSCAASGADRFACNHAGDLAPGVLIITGTAAAASANPQAFLRASVQSANDPIPANNEAEATLSIEPPVEDDVRISLSLGNVVPSVRTSEQFGYEFVVANSGSDPAVGVRLDISLDPALRFATGVGTPMAPGFNCSGAFPNFLCSLTSTLPGGQTRSVSFSLQAPAQPATLSSSAVASAEADATPGDNQITVTTEVRQASEEEIEEILDDALDGIDDPQVQDNIGALAGVCANPQGELQRALCGEIIDQSEQGNGREVADAIGEILGVQTTSLQTSLEQAVQTQFNNVDARQNENRGLKSGFSIAGLNVRYGDEIFPLALLQSDQSEDPTVGRGELISPWGFFINGTISAGERDPSSREVAFDFDTYGVTAGVDYRLKADTIVGAALGYSNFDSEYAEGGSLENSGFTFTAYGSTYFLENLYLDGRFSYGFLNFDQVRPIRIELGDLVIDETAVGDTDANTISAALGTGYHLSKGAWSFTPSLRVGYQRSSIDGFRETGADDLVLNYADQNVDSFISTLGLSVSRALSFSRGVFVPQADLNYNYEALQNGDSFDAAIFGAAAGDAFFISPDDPDRSFGNVGVGGVFVTSGGKQAYFSYRRLLGLEDLSRWSVDLGIRMEF